MTSKVTGKVALVTGGSSGIGLAAAKRLVDEGAYVYITGRRTEELDKAVANIGHDIRAIPGDIGDLDSLDELYAMIREESGRLDILVASASIFEGRPALGVDPDHFDRVFNINARGTFFTVQKAIPLFDRGGSIVLISSAPTVKGVPSYGIYAASKVAIRSFGRTWAIELRDRAIRVNVVSPGVTETPMVAAALEVARQAIESTSPMGRVGRPEEIASAIYYLASDESSYTTGFELVADGGLTEL